MMQHLTTQRDTFKLFFLIHFLLLSHVKQTNKKKPQPNNTVRIRAPVSISTFTGKALGWPHSYVWPRDNETKEQLHFERCVHFFASLLILCCAEQFITQSLENLQCFQESMKKKTKHKPHRQTATTLQQADQLFLSWLNQEKC